MFLTSERELWNKRVSHVELVILIVLFIDALFKLFPKRKRQLRPYHFLCFVQRIVKLLSLISKDLNYYLSLDLIDDINL